MGVHKLRRADAIFRKETLKTSQGTRYLLGTASSSAGKRKLYCPSVRGLGAKRQGENRRYGRTAFEVQANKSAPGYVVRGGRRRADQTDIAGSVLEGERHLKRGCGLTSRLELRAQRVEKPKHQKDELRKIFDAKARIKAETVIWFLLRRHEQAIIPPR